MQNGGGGHLENHKKTRYFRNGLIDIYEIWYGDAKGESQPPRPLKNFNFKKSRWQTASILEKPLNRHISATV